jgi:hypothetical protein
LTEDRIWQLCPQISDYVLEAEIKQRMLALTKARFLTAWGASNRDQLEGPHQVVEASISNKKEVQVFFQITRFQDKFSGYRSFYLIGIVGQNICCFRVKGT